MNNPIYEEDLIRVLDELINDKNFAAVNRVLNDVQYTFSKYAEYTEKMQQLTIGINPNTFIVKNARRCTLCEGSVDRLQFLFECTSCGAIGDLITGIMVDMSFPETK